jgi:hypothetical protein
MFKKALLPILLILALAAVLLTLAYWGEHKGWETFFPPGGHR